MTKVEDVALAIGQALFGFCTPEATPNTWIDAKAAAQAAIGVMTWQPIETAPRDEVLDIWIERINPSEPPGYRIINCYWDGPRNAPPSIGEDNWIGWTYDDETAHRSYPVEGHDEVATHWMRPPGPPEAAP